MAVGARRRDPRPGRVASRQGGSRVRIGDRRSLAEKTAFDAIFTRNVATAKKWYESPAYQKAKKFREGACDAELFLIEAGAVAPPDRMPDTKNRKA